MFCLPFLIRWWPYRPVVVVIRHRRCFRGRCLCRRRCCSCRHLPPPLPVICLIVVCIADRLLLLCLHLNATIIPLANARRQIVVVNVVVIVDVVVVVVVVVVTTWSSHRRRRRRPHAARTHHHRYSQRQRRRRHRHRRHLFCLLSAAATATIDC